ncbi:hypothetical protein [Natronoglomus mannanivorans]|uniref:Uncharacterized protein n=1 Tax=Natronoglomus mannanivorans TaxID=2979990 RepID=A0AAP3E358_9EURY|nr:hypothetical protein [Halobacteria archaeon AArc-xg1-1]
MSQVLSLFRSPLFRWGIAVFDAALVAAAGFFIVEDETVQLLVYAFAAAGLVLTPLILKRAAEKE